MNIIVEWPIVVYRRLGYVMEEMIVSIRTHRMNWVNAWRERKTALNREEFSDRLPDGGRNVFSGWIYLSSKESMHTIECCLWWDLCKEIVWWRLFEEISLVYRTARTRAMNLPRPVVRTNVSLDDSSIFYSKDFPVSVLLSNSRANPINYVFRSLISAIRSPNVTTGVMKCHAVVLSKIMSVKNYSTAAV